MNKDLIINKSAFPFYIDYWQQYFSRLSGDQCKEVLRIVCEFNSSGEQEKHSDFGIDMVSNSIITNVIRDARKRERRIVASRDNGTKGGRPKKNTFSENLEKPISFCKPTLEEVKTYCKERNNGVDANKWFDFYTAKDWKIGKNTMKDWKAAIRTWESNENPIQSKISSFADELNTIAGSSLFEKIYEEELNGEKVAMIKFTSLSSKDKWSALPEETKSKVKAKIASKFNGKMRMA